MSIDVSVHLPRDLAIGQQARPYNTYVIGWNVTAQTSPVSADDPNVTVAIEIQDAHNLQEVRIFGSPDQLLALGRAICTGVLAQKRAILLQHQDALIARHEQESRALDTEAAELAAETHVVLDGIDALVALGVTTGE